jgi:hypothetical protein
MSANQPTAFSTVTRTRGRSKEILAAAASASHPTRAQSVVIAEAHRWLTRASNEWLPRLTWSVQRTGRAGVSGLALLLASLVFLVSTHLPLAHEVGDLHSQLTAARVQSAAAPAPVSDYGTALLRSLPQRAQMPALLGVLLQQADAAHLSLDTGKYESTALKSGGVMTYQISFPVTGAYPQVRRFIDATLTALPAVAMSELSLTRKTIGDGAVEAQIRLTVFTQDSP